VRRGVLSEALAWSGWQCHLSLLIKASQDLLGAAQVKESRVAPEKCLRKHACEVIIAGQNTRSSWLQWVKERPDSSFRDWDTRV